MAEELSGDIRASYQNIWKLKLTKMEQDFSKKIAIVVDKNLESWQVLNCVAHISAYLGNKMEDKFDTGDFFETKDGKSHPRNSQFPIIVLSGTFGQLTNLIGDVRDSGMLYIGFIKEMIETTNDEEIVKSLTKKFSLWK